MRKLLLTIVLVLTLVGITDAANETLLQVTLGAGATQLQATSQPVREIIIQNNAAHSMRVGDSTVSGTKGIFLAAGPGGGSVTVFPAQGYSLDVSDWWVFGTAADVVDVLYVK